jgi:hypothetical protein
MIFVFYRSPCNIRFEVFAMPLAIIEDGIAAINKLCTSDHKAGFSKYGFIPGNGEGIKEPQ